MKKPKLEENLPLETEEEIKTAMERLGRFFANIDEFEGVESDLSKTGRPMAKEILELLEKSESLSADPEVAESIKSKIRQLISLIEKKTPMMAPNIKLFLKDLEELVQKIAVKKRDE